MKSTRNIGLAAALAATLVVAACGGNDDEPVSVGNALEVPDSAGASSAAFVGYVQTLAAGDETAEPLTIRDAFAVPPDDDGEPSPLG